MGHKESDVTGQLNGYIYIYATHTHTHTHTEYCSAIEDETMPFIATWLDLEIITLGEIRKRDTIRYHLYVESKI